MMPQPLVPFPRLLTAPPYNLLCRVGFHLWKRWRVVERHEIVADLSKTHAVGRTLVQERECEACGLTHQFINTRYV